MFNFIDIYSFISVIGCVGISPSVLLCPRAYYAVKTALILYILLFCWRVLVHITFCIWNMYYI